MVIMVFCRRYEVCMIQNFPEENGRQIGNGTDKTSGYLANISFLTNRR